MTSRKNTFWNKDRFFAAAPFLRSRQAEKSARGLLAAIEAAGDGIGIVDPEGNLTYMNKALMILHGIDKSRLSDFIGHGWENLYSEKGRAILVEHVLPALKRDGFWRGESPIVRQDGGIAIAEMSLTLLEDGGFIGTARDITAQKKAEKEKDILHRQFIQAQKMEVVGRLTGGIAHDFNNLLTVLSGNLELLEDARNPQQQKQIAAMNRAVGRGADLTQRLLAFSRQQVLKPQITNVNTLIPETIKLIRKAVSDRVEIVTKFSEGLWRVEIDEGQLENAILNLAINARDAMPDGGQLIIETKNTALSAQSPEREHYMPPGNYVVISVTDTGTGIPPDIIQRVFEPFFTTKETGKGSGLGLSMVYGFIKQSGGHVTIDSEVGRGTSINLFFPQAKSGANALPQESTRAAPLPPRGHETVLIVEDEPDILNLSRDLMTSLGYKVHTAENGAQAILMMKKMKILDLLLTDVVMPGGIDGKDLAEEVKILFPASKVLFVSGYARDAISSENLTPENAVLLSKPYSREILAQTVRKVLETV